MNTDTGRIYEPEEFERRQRQMTSAATHADVIEQLEGAEAKRQERTEQRAFERAMREGKIVPVSEEVAKRVETGRRVEERRRKRKAAKAARRAGRRR